MIDESEIFKVAWIDLSDSRPNKTCYLGNPRPISAAFHRYLYDTGTLRETVKCVECDKGVIASDSGNEWVCSYCGGTGLRVKPYE